VGLLRELVMKFETINTQITSSIPILSELGKSRIYDRSEAEGLESKPACQPLNKKSIPIFKPEYIDDIFHLLKDFFTVESQDEFKRLLETGCDTNSQLLFLDNGARLADVFKQLKNNDIITGVSKVELQNWILTNFRYKYRGTIKIYKEKYLKHVISTNWDVCKTPILEIRNSKGRFIIEKV
jgi:hypothetical protein